VRAEREVAMVLNDPDLRHATSSPPLCTAVWDEKSMERGLNPPGWLHHPRACSGVLFGNHRGQSMVDTNGPADSPERPPLT
jgi:hypothetical protein